MESNLLIPLISTKTMIPTVPTNFIHRDHLCDCIEKGIDQGLILVSTPPGYGKSTLVADWIKHSAASVAWLTLDKHDNDLRTFIRYLNVCLGKFLPEFKTASSTSKIDDNPDQNFKSLLVSFINQCSFKSSDFTLVMDDYQVIENPEIHEGISFLVDHFPPHFRLIIITRSDPPLSLAKLRANHRIIELHAHDLKFSQAETFQYITQIKQLDLSESEVDQLYDQTEGWITGLQLASLSHGDYRFSPPSSLTVSSNANLTLEYLVEEVINHQPEQIQAFLYRSSILNGLYGPLCDYVLGIDQKNGSQELLHSLYHQNLFLSSLDPDEHWFRYHSIFAGVLRHLLLEKYPDEVPGLYLRASEWCDRNNLIQEALSYAEASHDKAWNLALLDKLAINIIKNGNALDFMFNITKKEEALISLSPILSLVKTWDAAISLDLDTMVIWLEKTLSLLADPLVMSKYRSIETSLMGLVAATQSLFAAINGDSLKSMDFSKKALSLLPPENSYTHSFALLNQGLTFSLNGNIKKGIEVLNQAITTSHKSGNWLALVIARSNLGVILISHGQLDKALTLFQQSIRFKTTDFGKNSGLEELLCMEIGGIYLIRNQLNEANQYYERFGSLTKDNPSILNNLDIHLHMARLYHCQGNFNLSTIEIESARQISIISQSQLDDLLVDLVEAKLSLLRGQIDTSRQWTQIFDPSNQGDNYPCSNIPFALSVEARLLSARMALVLGRQSTGSERFDQTFKILKELIPVLDSSGLVQYQIETHILAALAYHELGNMEEMITSLTKALILAEPEAIRQVFLDEGIYISRLLVHYQTYLKKEKGKGNFPLQNFVSDLLFRQNGKEIEKRAAEIPQVNMTDEEYPGIDFLTFRESEVLQLVARGRTNSEIALDLHISINTVKRHLNNAFMKLGVTTRTQAIRVAQQHGFIK